MATKTEEQTISPHPNFSSFSYKFSDFTIIATYQSRGTSYWYSTIYVPTSKQSTEINLQHHG